MCTNLDERTQSITKYLQNHLKQFSRHISIKRMLREKAKQNELELHMARKPRNVRHEFLIAVFHDDCF